MAAFINLEDSPMFEKEISSLELIADELKDRCQRLCKGSKRFAAVLGEACNADTYFADSLEAFGAGQDDPVSVSIGGPVISRFINAFREIASYKELLRSQVEHVLIDRLMHFMEVDLQDVKESHRRFDKAVHNYDQSREKFVSLKKNTRGEIVEELEEDLQNSKSAFERSRFNLVSSLMNVEAKKKYEFLESISAFMDAHLKYFKLGYSLLSQMEPFIHQILTYAQQSKELANIEQDKLAKRIQEFRTQAEMATVRGPIDTESSVRAGSIHAVNRDSYKDIEAIMRSTENGEVQTIKQGYLLKRSSGLRGDWKRRFFVLDSQGTLYYYRNKTPKPPTGTHHRSSISAEQNTGVFARFRSRHSRATSLVDANFACHTIDLHTSTLKMDADDSDLRLCFRIISPMKTYTLQAENGADRMDWVNKITGVIASLFNSHFLQQPQLSMKQLQISEMSGDSADKLLDSSQHFNDNMKVDGANSVSIVLREIPGNELCAECSAPNPDWASLNLGILLCIECSGVHRNLGVHKSKVRSLTLDVKVWEPTVVDLFRSLGNAYCNSLWEGLLQLPNERAEESNSTILSIRKPCPRDAINIREKYIQAKYVEKALVVREAIASDAHSNSSSIWEAVKTNNLREVYRYIVISEVTIVNTTFDGALGAGFHQNIIDTQYSELALCGSERKHSDPASCPRIKDSNDRESCFQGCSLLHLACHCGNLVMLELLLQFGADINFCDFHGRTPLHHCISKGDHQLAKFLLRRGASPSLRDGGGLSALERAMEKGAITDEELFILLSEC